jgi:hypothetical protein
MKKVIIISSLFILIILFLVLIAGIVYKANAQIKIEGSIRRLPEFSYITVDNKEFSSGEIKNGPLLIIHFNPECEHCKYETENIIGSNIPYMNCRVLMITEAPLDSVKRFHSSYNLEKYSSITVLIDTSYLFVKKFGSSLIPTNYIYNKDLELVKVLTGEYKTETIIKYLTFSE